MVLTSSFGRASPIVGALGFARYLHEHGVEVLFASLDAQYLQGRHILDEVRTSGVPHACFNVVGWQGLLRHVHRIRSYVQDRSIDVVVSCLLRPDLANAWLPNVLRIASLRIATREGLGSSHGRLVTDVATRMHTMALKRMDGIFSMSTEMTDDLVSAGIRPTQICTVNNFVDVTAISRFARDTTDSAVVHIGLFGRLIPRKRVDLAIQAMAILVHRHGCRAVQLHVVGDGPLQSAMMTLAHELKVSDRVIFHGYMPEPFPLMAKMNLVVLTSESEGTPRCLMEAMAMGKTCVSSSIAGVQHLTIEKKTGYLFQPRDAEGLAALLHRVITHRLYLSAQEVIKFMQDNFDVGGCSGQMLKEIEHLLHARY